MVTRTPSEIVDSIMEIMPQVEELYSLTEYERARDFLNGILNEVHFDCHKSTLELGLHSGLGFVSAVCSLSQGLENSSPLESDYFRKVKSYYVQTKLPKREIDY